MKPILLFLLLFVGVQAVGQDLYFPPKASNAWETTDPESLGWCQQSIDSLYDFLENEETKSFIVLKDGKIVLEKYFGGFTADSLWAWFSAGKSLRASLVGIKLH